jgi:hypothetical protein
MSLVIRDREHYKTTPIPHQSESGALIPNTARPAQQYKPPKQTPSEKFTGEVHLRARVLELWNLLDRLRGSMESGDNEAVEQWMRFASELIGEFRRFKGFFPYEKGKRITWFDGLERALREGEEGKGRRKIGVGDIEGRVEEIQTRLTGRNVGMCFGGC